MANHLHLTVSQRIEIEIGLTQRRSFRAIAAGLDKSPSTIAKEVRAHLIFRKTGGFGRAFNDCLFRKQCPESAICKFCIAKRPRTCTFCSQGCGPSCPSYKSERCKRLAISPYVCNGCSVKNSCTLEKSFYYAKEAQKEYELIRSESRSGVAMAPDEVRHLDELISPLIRNGHSIHHIWANNRDSIMCSEKTLYNLIDASVFTVGNLDLPRKVRYRKRKKLKPFKVDTRCRIGRAYNDYLTFIA